MRSYMGRLSRPSRLGCVPASISKRCPSSSTNHALAPMSLSGFRLIICMLEGSWPNGYEEVQLRGRLRAVGEPFVNMHEIYFGAGFCGAGLALVAPLGPFFITPCINSIMSSYWAYPPGGSN